MNDEIITVYDVVDELNELAKQHPKHSICVYCGRFKMDDAFVSLTPVGTIRHNMCKECYTSLHLKYGKKVNELYDVDGLETFDGIIFYGKEYRVGNSYWYRPKRKKKHD